MICPTRTMKGFATMIEQKVWEQVNARYIPDAGVEIKEPCGELLSFQGCREVT